MASRLRIIVTAGGGKGALCCHDTLCRIIGRFIRLRHETWLHCFVPIWLKWQLHWVLVLKNTLVLFGYHKSPPASLRMIYLAMFAFYWLKFKVSRVRRQNAVLSFSLTCLFNILQRFLTFSALSLTDRLIHVLVLQYPLIQCYWVISGDGLLSRSAQSPNWFSIMTNNR